MEKEKLNELIENLDEIARDLCNYEFGLPIYDEGSKARMRERISEWLEKNGH